VCAVHNMAFFCSSLKSRFPGMLLGYCLSDFEMVPVAPSTTGNTFAFTFHLRCICIIIIIIIITITLPYVCRIEVIETFDDFTLTLHVATVLPIDAQLWQTHSTVVLLCLIEIPSRLTICNLLITSLDQFILNLRIPFVINLLTFCTFLLLFL
jgi:hypothetical protein